MKTPWSWGLERTAPSGISKEIRKRSSLSWNRGKSVTDWKGARVYLEAVDMETQGDFYDQIKGNITKMAGEGSAEMIHAAIRFKITEVRPLID